MLDELVDRIVHGVGIVLVGWDEAMVDFACRFGLIVLLDDQDAASSLTGELPDLVDAGYRGLSVNGRCEVGDGLLALLLEVFAQDRPRLLTEVVPSCLLVSSADPADDVLRIAADVFEQGG